MTTPDRTPRQIRLLTALLLFGTFLLGAMAGAGFYRFTSAPFPPGFRHPRAPFLPGPPGALQLTPEQEATAKEITDAYRPKLEALLREGFPKFQAINEAMEKEMRAVLTPSQLRTLDELKARRPAMPPGMGHRFSPSPGGGPPGMPGEPMMPPPFGAPPGPPPR